MGNPRRISSAPLGTEFKVPFFPALDKSSIPSLSALLGCAVFVHRLPRFFRGYDLPALLLLLVLVGPFVTSMLNDDPIVIGSTFLPGVGAYDAGSAAFSTFIWILPFFLGRHFFRDPESSGEILKAIVIAGLGYSLLMLFEIRMSPQLHTWIYGFASASFGIDVRSGGYPAASLPRQRAYRRIFCRYSGGRGSGFVADQSKNSPGAAGGGGFVLGNHTCPLQNGGRHHLRRRAGTVNSLGQSKGTASRRGRAGHYRMVYPLLRVADVFPTTTLLNVAQSVSAERAESLQTRFDQEDQLLRHAWERRWFGWGRYGRNRVYTGWDGKDSSITDGYWIIVIGTFGIVGFISQFGLLGLAVFRTASALKYVKSERERIYLAALALILTANIVDMLPNASISPWTWLLVGALLGQAEAVRRQVSQKIRKPDRSFEPAQLLTGPTQAEPLQRQVSAVVDRPTRDIRDIDVRRR